MPLKHSHLMEQIFQECILEVKKQGKTVFLSSHILAEVEALCDRVGIIRQGKIVESGTLEELFMLHYGDKLEGKETN